MDHVSQIIFRPGHLAAFLAQRADRDAGLSVHRVAQRDLDRYYALLGEHPPFLTLDQARFLVAAENGVAVGEGAAYLDALRMMPVEVRDAPDDPPPDIDPADGQALLAAVRPGRCSSAPPSWTPSSGSGRATIGGTSTIGSQRRFAWIAAPIIRRMTRKRQATAACSARCLDPSAPSMPMKERSNARGMAQMSLQGIPGKERDLIRRIDPNGDRQP